MGAATTGSLAAAMIPRASLANLGMPEPAPPFDGRRLVNVERAYRFMDEQKLDALIALNPVNVFYLTNFISYRSKMAVTPYASFAVFPRNPRAPTGLVVVSTDLWEIGSAERAYPELVVPYSAPVDWADIRDNGQFSREPTASPGARWPFEESNFTDREHIWHAIDQRWFGKMAPTPEWALVRILKELGLSKARVAVDDMRIDRILKWSGLASVSCEEGDNLFRKIRLAKSEPEIGHMRQAARINQDAAMATLRQLEAGATRADIDRIFMIEAAKRGGKSTWIAAGTPAGLTTRELSRGQSLLIDTVCQYNYYHGDFGRTFVLGEPSKLQKDRARVMEIGWRAAFESADSTFKSPTDGDAPRSPTAQRLDGYRCPPPTRPDQPARPVDPACNPPRIPLFPGLPFTGRDRARPASASAARVGLGIQSRRPSRQRHSNLPCRGGARATIGASSGSAAPQSRSRCARMRAITSGSSMLAITRSRPWQRAQVSISIANTLFSRCAQLIATCFGTAGASALASCFAPFPPAPRPAGVIAARNLLCGANTP